MDSQILLDAVAELVREQTQELERKLQVAQEQVVTLRRELEVFEGRFDESLEAGVDKFTVDKLRVRVEALEVKAPEADTRIDELEQRISEIPNFKSIVDELPDVAAADARIRAEFDEKINAQLTTWSRNLQQRISDEAHSLNEEITPEFERIDEALGSINEALGLLQSMIEAKTDDQALATANDAVEKASKAPQEALELLLKHYQSVEDWKRGGAGYKACSVVRHRGALWQAPQDTLREPGAGDDWALLADGISEVRTDCDDNGTFSFIVKMASGAETVTQYQLPHINFRGVYDENAEYAKYDCMVRDGHTFMALVDKPGEVGVNKGEWMTIGYRGKAGKRAPSLDEVIQSIKVPVVESLSKELPDLVAVAVGAIEQ